MNTREEKDFLGTMSLPENALFGIHALRARENFQGHETFSLEWYKAIALTKLAVYRAVELFKKELSRQYPKQELPIKLPENSKLKALIQAAEEVSSGKHFEHFIVPGISGGAGTSLNMNVNEIICNRALEILNLKPGNYAELDPIEGANIFQSTNDIIPSSLRICLIKKVSKLEESINDTRLVLENLEKTHRYSLRVAYTQMQQAVPSSYGHLFGAWQEAFSRDWWRLSKISERLKVINLGGSAIGTGITIPQFVIFKATEELRALTGFPLARAEQLSDATMNLDPLVEAHAILKAHAVNLEKIASDLRLLGSDLFEGRSLSIPPRQVGSSIMPGKVNPVISEYVISLSHAVYANDQIITSLAAQGTLELNAYLPIIGHAFIDSLKKLLASNLSLREYLLKGIQIDTLKSQTSLFSSPSITTALVPFIGYNKASELAKLIKNEHLSIFEANERLNILNDEKLKDLLAPANLLRLGFKVSDLLKSETEK